jgi:5-methylcytosine-specific restriction endonuclease McrA
LPYKDPAVRKAKHKQYSANYYERNKEKVRAKTRRSNQNRTAWWKAYKASLGCFGCDENDPACLEFHHVVPDAKKHREDSANEWMRKGKSREAIVEEIRTTCVPLCANCHRKVHELARNLVKEEAA